MRRTIAIVAAALTFCESASAVSEWKPPRKQALSVRRGRDAIRQWYYRHDYAVRFDLCGNVRSDEVECSDGQLIEIDMSGQRLVEWTDNVDDAVLRHGRIVVVPGSMSFTTPLWQR